MCRLKSSELNWEEKQKVVQSLKGLLSDCNLLNFKDRKLSNFVHLSLKGLKPNERFDPDSLLEILNQFKDGEKYVMSDIKEKIKNLIIQENKNNESPLGEAFLKS